MSRATRVSYDYIEQTCPIVDSLTDTFIQVMVKDLDNNFDLDTTLKNQLLDNIEDRVSILIGKIKENVTEKFREALIDSISENTALEDEATEQQNRADEIQNLLDMVERDNEYYQDMINELENKVSDLETKLDELEN